jgi:hypothetical protein
LSREGPMIRGVLHLRFVTFKAKRLYFEDK